MKTVAVFFGGKSAEHDVSIITGHTPIIQSLQATGEYDIYPVYIARDGSWYSIPEMNNLAYFKKDLEEKLSKEKKIRFDINDGLTLIWPGLREKKVSIDVAFPAMHGTYGEDGSLMGILRMAGIPFVGCDMAASAVAMDKAFTKQIMEAEGVPVVPYVWFTKYQWETKRDNYLREIENLSYPLFVKPVHLGSSIAISKVRDAGELKNAIEAALHYDDKVLVEEGVENLIEVTLPIMGNERLTFGAIERPMNDTDFFDFSDKYLGGGKGGGVNTEYSEIPAKISEELSQKVLEYGERTYRTLGCAGIARVDFLIDSQTEEVYVNEVNTLPGSLYHHNWKKVGVSGVELCTRLVAFAEERFAEQKDTTFAFESDILSKAGGQKMHE